MGQVCWRALRNLVLVILELLATTCNHESTTWIQLIPEMIAFVTQDR
jgi:hypothetical protein